MIDLRSLEVFCIVAHSGGFHRAAEKLHMTQPAISTRIAQLEQELKVRLFERDKRGSHLTPKGRVLLQYAERMLRLRTEMMLTVAGPSGFAGTVQLGVSDTIVHTWLPDLLRQINKNYPLVTIEIIVDSSASLASALLDNSIDVALLLGPLNAWNVIDVPLCDYPISWIVAADCPLQSGQVTIADLANFPIITFRRQTKPYCQVKELFNSAGLNKIQMFAISSLSSIIRMTLDNIGIAAIPQAVAVEHLTSKQLRILDTGQAMPVMTFTASYVERTDSPLNAMVANLAREVAARFHSS